jgi:hypothetical protein
VEVAHHAVNWFGVFDSVFPTAWKVAVGFKNAVVLHQKSAGHFSLSAASFCTAKVVREYFRNGVLPEKGKACEIESRMFGRPVRATGILDENDERLMQAVTEVSGTIEPPVFHL